MIYVFFIRHLFKRILSPLSLNSFLQKGHPTIFGPLSKVCLIIERLEIGLINDPPVEDADTFDESDSSES